jgi:hypothetical protein
VAVLGALNSCVDLLGVPVPPDMITEDSARTIINKVFSESGIDMKADVEHLLIFDENDSLKVNLDGYNDSLKVGYEFMNWAEDTVIINKEHTKMASADNSNIKLLHKCQIEIAEEEFEQTISDFIDSLKFVGNI